MDMNRNIGWITTPIMLIAGVVFFWHSLDIPAGSSDAIGPRLVPMLMSGAAILLCLPLIYHDLRPHRRAKWANDDITIEALLLTAGPLILMVAVYGNMLAWFGYLLSTIACSIVVFRLFGNSIRASLIHGVIGGIVFYALFIRFMGIYDPSGSILNISDLLR